MQERAKKAQAEAADSKKAEEAGADVFGETGVCMSATMTARRWTPIRDVAAPLVGSTVWVRGRARRQSRNVPAGPGFLSTLQDDDASNVPTPRRSSRAVVVEFGPSQVHAIRAKGNLAFLVLRQSCFTLQAVAAAGDGGVPKAMIGFLGGRPGEKPRAASSEMRISADYPSRSRGGVESRARTSR